MRNYENIDKYLDILAKDIYHQPQPSNDAHTPWAQAAIDAMIPAIDCKTVLDVGCGLGFCKRMFEGLNVKWMGVDLDDANDKTILRQDMSFLDFDDGSFDLIFGRHILEHSPMPLLTLMEWHRVSKKWALIILPTPDYWNYGGRNHYHVLPKEAWEALFLAAGWKIAATNGFGTQDKLFRDYYPSKENPVPYPDPQKPVEYWFRLEK